MKKLFLASFALVSLDLVEELLPKPASELKAAFIPTAGDLYEGKEFVHVDRKKLESMGFSVRDIDLKDKQLENLEDEFKDIDLVLVAGGNTFYLLDYMRKSGFDQLLPRLLDNGVVYVGSSAGSIVCCPTIEGAKKFDDPKDAPDLVSYEGLNFYNEVIIPHAQKEKYRERIKETIQEMAQKGLNITTLTDNEAVLINDDEVKKVTISQG
jgi:dipeptidase E